MDHKPSIKAAMARQRREHISGYWLAGYDAFESGIQIHGIGITTAELVEIAETFRANVTLLATIAGNVEQRGIQFDRRNA